MLGGKAGETAVALARGVEPDKIEGATTFDGGAKQADEAFASERVPTFAEVLARYGTDVRYYVETKKLLAGEGMEEAMVADLQQAQPGTPSMWLTYVVVDDLGRARERVKQLGGAVVVPLIEVPNVGNIALIADPTGGHIGLFEAPKG